MYNLHAVKRVRYACIHWQLESPSPPRDNPRHTFFTPWQSIHKPISLKAQVLKKWLLAGHGTVRGTLSNNDHFHWDFEASHHRAQSDSASVARTTTIFKFVTNCSFRFRRWHIQYGRIASRGWAFFILVNVLMMATRYTAVFETTLVGCLSRSLFRGRRGLLPEIVDDGVVIDLTEM